MVTSHPCFDCVDSQLSSVVWSPSYIIIFHAIVPLCHYSVSFAYFFICLLFNWMSCWSLLLGFPDLLFNQVHVSLFFVCCRKVSNLPMSEVYFYVYKVRQRLWSTRTTRPMGSRPMKEGFPLEENEAERNEEQDREREEDKEKDGEKKERKDDSLVEEGGF